MPIDPKIEGPTRAMISHAIRGERDQYTGVIEDVGEERFLQCLGLCRRIAGYVVIDVSGHKWPSDFDLRDIARRMAAVELDLDLSEPAVYDYLSRCALGFEPLADVFPDKGQAGVVPVSVAAALLVAYRRHGTDWWDYLEQIERALEIAAQLPEGAFPAALLLSREKHARDER
jgi:hypothetical protein